MASALKKINNIVLWMTEDCNLRCSYCFVEKKNKQISESVMDSLLEFISKNKEQFAEYVNINFTGGEPLLAFEQIRYFVNKYDNMRHKLPPVMFTIITNGTLLNDNIIEYLQERQISLILSLDGLPSVMAEQRPFSDGSSSYRADLEEMLKKLTDRNISLKARLTFTPDSLSLTSNIRHLFEIGAKEVMILPDMEELWDDRKLPALRTALRELALFFIEEAKKGVIHNINVFGEYLIRYILTRSNESGMRHFPCESGTGTISVTVDGDFYPCHHWHNQYNRTGMSYNHKNMQLGSLSSGLDNSRRVVFCDFSSSKIPECSLCSARYICGGPCYAISYLYYGDLYKTYSGQCIYMREVNTVISYVVSSLSNEYPEIYHQLTDKYISGKSSKSCCD
ncbi:MAG: radical SAM protein [Firmicutes bacterium]|nr:radical SAM protein [Bacillota bacterium]